MEWGKIYGDYHRHRKTAGLSMPARGLWTTMLSWCIDCASGGHITDEVVAALCPDGRVRRPALAELQRREWVEREDGGYYVHGYEDRQDESTIEHRRQADRERKRRQRDRVSIGSRSGVDRESIAHRPHVDPDRSGDNPRARAASNTQIGHVTERDTSRDVTALESDSDKRGPSRPKGERVKPLHRAHARETSPAPTRDQATGELVFGGPLPEMSRWQRAYDEAARAAGRTDFEIAPYIGAIEAAAANALRRGVDPELVEAAVRLNAEKTKPPGRLHIEVGEVRRRRAGPGSVIDLGARIATWSEQNPEEAAAVEARCRAAEAAAQERAARVRAGGSR